MSVAIILRGKMTQNKTLISYAQNFIVLPKEPPHRKIKAKSIFPEESN